MVTRLLGPPCLIFSVPVYLALFLFVFLILFLSLFLRYNVDDLQGEIRQYFHILSVAPI
jgi:hypothetical protein